MPKSFEEYQQQNVGRKEAISLEKELNRLISENTDAQKETLSFRSKTLNIANTMAETLATEIKQSGYLKTHHEDLANVLSKISEEKIDQATLDELLADLSEKQAFYEDAKHGSIAAQYAEMIKLLGVKDTEQKTMARSKEIVEGLDDITGGLVSKVTSFTDKLGEAKTSWAKGLIITGAIVGVFKMLADWTDRIGEKFGAIGIKSFRGQLMEASVDAQKLGYGFEDVATVAETLSTEFGVGFDTAIDLSESVLDTARALGLGADESAKLVGQLMTVTNLSAEGAANLMKQATALAKSAGIAPSTILKDIAGSSEDVAKFTKGSGENIATAAVNARKLGLAFGDVAQIAEGLLDFETSISKEMEASIMLGQQLNFQRARQFALENRLSEMTGEVLSQLGEQVQWGSLDIFQRKAISESLGVSVDQMSKLIKFQGKSLEQLSSMKSLKIDELVGTEAISMVTLLLNQLKALGTYLLVGISYIATFGGNLRGVGGMIATTIIGTVLAAATAFGIFALKAKLMGWAMKTLSIESSASAPGLFAGAAGLGSLALAVLGFGIGIGIVVFAVSKLIESFTGLMSVLIEGGSESILILGGMSLAFFGLAASLAAISIAGIGALPVLAALAATGALFGTFGGEAKEAKLMSVYDDKVNTNVTTLAEEIKGLRSDMRIYFGIGGTVARDTGKSMIKGLATAEGTI